MIDKQEKILFEETQKNIGLMIAPIFAAIFFGLIAAVQIVARKSIGNHPLSNTALVIICIIGIICAVFINTQKLRTIITTEEIKYSFGLFAGKDRISISNIKSVTIGDAGLEITLTSDRKILINTQRKRDLELVLQNPVFDKVYKA